MRHTQGPSQNGFASRFQVDLDAVRSAERGLAHVVDRWIYVFMAGLFLVAVLVDFIPDSIGKLDAVRTGQRPPFPAILHVHAALMGAWMLLLLTQTILMVTNRPALHKQLGLVSFALAPILVVVGFLLIPTMRHETAEAILHAPPAVAASLKPGFEFTLNIMLVQIRIGVLFAVLIALGLLARRRDSGLHKRLMILGTAAALPPALDRMMMWVNRCRVVLSCSTFGDGLKLWLARAPSFNVHKVHTPVRLQQESGGLTEILSKWEFFSGLRRLNKPVELYVIPDIDHGSHNIQFPAQCLASQQGAVDWIDFWLNGHTDPDPKKADQYQRWRALRKLHTHASE